MDEDGGDGPGGAAGEAEDGHSEHRWVDHKHTQQQLRLPGHCVVYCRGSCMSE